MTTCWAGPPRFGFFATAALAFATYVPQDPDEEGWQHSPVWGESFKLIGVTDALGEPDYELQVRGSA